MEEEHSLHKFIGNIVGKWAEGSTNEDNYIQLSPECGGWHKLPLFYYNEAGEGIEFAQADILIIKNGKVRCIIEIEESGITPIKLIGKFTTSILCNYYEYIERSGLPKAPLHLELDERLSFIQIVKDMDSFNKPRSKKPDQFKGIFECLQYLAASMEHADIEFEGIVYDTKKDILKDVLIGLLNRC